MATGPTASTTRAASEATGGLASAAGSEERTAASTARPGSEERSAASTARPGSEERSAASTVLSGVGGEVGVQELEEEGDGEGGG